MYFEWCFDPIVADAVPASSRSSALLVVAFCRLDERDRKRLRRYRVGHAPGRMPFAVMGRRALRMPLISTETVLWWISRDLHRDGSGGLVFDRRDESQRS